MFKNKFSLYWFLATIICIAITLTCSHLPGNGPSYGQLIWEEVTSMKLEGSNALEHFLMYGAITFFLGMSIKSFPSRRSAVFVVITILLLALTDEITQPFFHRTIGLVDYLADTAGLTVGLILCSYLKYHKILCAKSKGQYNK